MRSIKVRSRPSLADEVEEEVVMMVERPDGFPFDAGEIQHECDESTLVRLDDGRYAIRLPFSEGEVWDVIGEEE